MERNISIDYFKILLSILVVTIHMQPLFTIDSLAGWLISNGIGRIAVPCFFIINGYFLHSKILSRKDVFKYLKRIVTIYITWTLVFMLITIDYIDIRLIFSLFFGIYHLWYLSALIGAVIALYILKRFIKSNIILLITAIGFFLVGIYIQNYYFPISNAAIRVFMFRNALFFGLPFLILGYYIKEKAEKLKQIPAWLIISIIIISLSSLLYETSRIFNDKVILDIYYSMLVLAPALFLFILKKAKYKVNDGYTGLLTSGIYYIHPLAIYLLSANFGSDNKLIYMLPAVLILSSIMTAGIIEVNKRIKIFL